MSGRSFAWSCTPIVQGHDGIDNETFYNGFLRMQSDDARVRGSIRADLSPVQLEPRYSQASAKGGLQVDIDDDGDLDLGRTTRLPTMGIPNTLIVARGFIPFGPDPVGTRITYNGNPDAEEFLLGTVDFRVNAFGGSMELRLSMPDTGPAPTAMFVEDARNVLVHGAAATVQSDAAAAAPLLVSVLPEPSLFCSLFAIGGAYLLRRR